MRKMWGGGGGAFTQVADYYVCVNLVKLSEPSKFLFKELV